MPTDQIVLGGSTSKRFGGRTMSNSLETVMPVIMGFGKLVFGGGGFIALYFAAANWITGRRTHILTVYKETFQLLDAPGMREARSYVYSLAKEISNSVGGPSDGRQTFRVENWNTIELHRSNPSYPVWKEHRQKAE